MGSGGVLCAVWLLSLIVCRVSWGHQTDCLQHALQFPDYVRCLSRAKRQCDPSDPFGPCAEPCGNYVTLHQPERRVGNRLDKLTGSALCDRALRRRWYRFDSAAGGKMPESCVEEYSCGTHSPIWLNARHPSRRGDIRDLEVCASQGGQCCHARWYIRVANCGDFFTYLLHETRGCYQAYCIGDQLPCPPGQSSPTGFFPGCTGNFPHLGGNVTLSVGTEGDFVVFYCDFHGVMPQKAFVEVLWYIRGDLDDGERPVFRDRLQDRPRSTLTEGHWTRRLGSTVWCEMRARWENMRGVPSPPLRSQDYFAGIQISQRTVTVSESEEETEIALQSTVPVLCLPQYQDICTLSVQVAHDPRYSAKTCQDGRMRQIVFGDCSVDLTPDDWQEPRTVKVKAVRDFYNDGTKRMLVDFRPVYTTYLSEFWNNYQLPPVEVLSTDVKTKLCSSTGDPHIMTFDGLYYHVYLEGEFVLYKHKTLPIQINTRLERCGQTVSCNCAVAVKAGDDVIVVDRCERRMRNDAFGGQFPDGWRTLHRHALEQGRDWVHGLHIYEYDEGRRFTVHLPTGAFIEVAIGERDWLNVYLHASSDDWLKTEGLCGTFDDSPRNDFTLPDGVTSLPARDQGTCGTDPDVCRFAEAWRVGDSDSFFSEEVRVDLADHDFSAGQQRYCKCEKDPETQESVVVCNYNYDVDNCQSRREQAAGKDLTWELLGRHRRRRSTDRHDEDDDYFNTVFTFDSNYRGQEPGWPTASGLTEAHAHRHCQQFIVTSSIYALCVGFIEPRLHALIADCIIDIQVNDDLAWAQSALDSVAAECTEAIQVDANLWGIDPDDLGPEIPEQQDLPRENDDGALPTQPPTTTPTTTVAATADDIGASLLKRVCPSACSHQGQCVDGRCQCEAGFTGHDCSQGLQQPPQALHLSGGGLCDLSRKNCLQIRVYGTHFRNTSQLTCHLQELQCADGLVSQTLRLHEVPALFDTFEEVICPVPEVVLAEPSSPCRAFEVSVSQGSGSGGQATAPLVWLSYHSACRTCHHRGRESYCVPQSTGCEIGGECYASGDKNPENCCETCQPSLSPERFTPSFENHRPRLLPWRSTYQVTKGDPWQLTVQAVDPEGCRVDVTVDSTRAGHVTSSRLSDTQVQLTLRTQRLGSYKALVTARDQCGAEYSQNYHVMVSLK